MCLKNSKTHSDKSATSTRRVQDVSDSNSLLIGVSFYLQHE